jgi:hypothetical protein
VLNETLCSVCRNCSRGGGPRFCTDDLPKAEKQIRMITVMSRDHIARSIISRTFADTFNVQRSQLVAERKSLGLNYGGLFLVHELI